MSTNNVIDLFPQELSVKALFVYGYILIARQSSAAISALLRRAILDWGVPEAIKTDNGSDYVSNHIVRVSCGCVCRPGVQSPAGIFHVDAVSGRLAAADLAYALGPLGLDSGAQAQAFTLDSAHKAGHSQILIGLGGQKRGPAQAIGHQALGGGSLALVLRKPLKRASWKKQSTTLLSQ